MDYILEFSSPEIKCCEDCRFYVCGYYDPDGWGYDRYCTAEESPLTDDPDLRMDWCPLRKAEEETAEWIDKEVRGTMTNVCSKCGGTSVYPDKYCGNCGRSMRNGY